MKKLVIILSLCLFYLGFFTISKGNSLLLKIFSDKELHTLVFFLYPTMFYVLLPKKWYYIIPSITIFGFMTYGVELFQKLFTNRCYSLSDFKSSLNGFLLSFTLILILEFTSKIKLNLTSS